MTLVRPAFRVFCLRKSLGAIYRLGLRAYHQPGKLNYAPGSQFCLRRLLFSSTSSSLIRPLLPLRVSRPWCRRQLLAFSLAAILSSGLKTAVSCPMTVAVATVSFRVDFIFVPDTTVAASFAKPLSPCPVWLAPFRFCQVPSLLAVAGQCHRVPALTHVADYWRLPPRCGLGELA